MIELDYKKDSELFNKTAKEWADKIFADKEYIEKIKRGRAESNLKKDSIKPTQMRKFYDNLLEKHNELVINKQELDEVLPFIKMINSKVEYAYSRELINKSFRQMMTECISQLDCVEKIKNFKLFFESVIGFYKGRN